MPCYFPLQATFSVREDGKKNVTFSKTNYELFVKGIKPLGDNNLSLPCGRCMGCRLERSRQWALRCVHEAKMHEDNCFVTLTFSPEKIVEMCPKVSYQSKWNAFSPEPEATKWSYSLDRKHVQDFMKRMRLAFVPPCPEGHDKEEWTKEFGIRVFYCGEYGENGGRPHYHLCLFNFDFHDKKLWRTVNGSRYYNSQCLAELWPYGHSCIGDLTFESAAYVARYCTKKVTGSEAEEHYQGRLPEFCGMSLKPGIGRAWIDRYGKSDVFPYDEVVVRGVRCKPPRYYDKRLEAIDPIAFEALKLRRADRAEEKSADSTYERLATRLKCQEARFKKLIRNLENDHVV